ncbi:MAG: hypothetical protein H6728_17545 [Myxococcales bacterium]|nr:hypothetical protein [Myxococcales bacterium]
MYERRKRDFVKWLPLLFGLFLMAVSASGCGCDNKSTGEGAENNEVITDGGTDKGNIESEPEFDGTCTKRCDCPQGQECSEGKCVPTTIPVYCCDREGCPTGQSCNDFEDKPSVCAPRDTCKHPCDCKQGLGCVNGFCTATRKPTYCCERAGCKPGETCESIRGGQKTCGDEGATCNTACDCVSGLACINGQCSRSGQPVYCCEDSNCPTGERCQNSKGGFDTCQQQQACKTACDCQTGQACNNGKCESQPIPVYCCGKPDVCPAGQACERADGQRDKCPAEAQCKTPCDCAQGQDCQSGRCVVNPFPVYCCQLAGCPPNAACTNANGNQGTCSSPPCNNDAECGKASCNQTGDRCSQVTPTCQRGICINTVNEGTGVCDPTNGSCRIASECKVDCDCPQGQSCTNGKCTPPNPGAPARYCCIKTGCPAGQACFQPNGSPGVCPKVECRNSQDCGNPTCQNVGNDCVQFKPFCDDAGQCSTTRGAIQNNSQCGADGICGPTQAQCKTACDCNQGQDCQGGRCISTPSPVYCCENAGCPPGVKCIDRTGTTGTCKQVACKTDADCGGSGCRDAGNDCLQENFRCDISTNQCFGAGSLVRNAICDAATKTCKPRTSQCRTNTDCGTPTCRQNGQICQQNIPTCNNGTCIGAGSSTVGTCGPNGTCQNAQFCRTACDCPQGQSCQTSPVGTGVCVASSTPTYCCDKAGCPAGEKCINTQNQGDFCKGSCTSACDCPAGQDCINGACTSTTPAVYCCDNPSQCPSGAACKDKTGALKTCPQVQRKCNSPCDCVQGEACTNGFCAATSSTPVFCCSAPGCTPGATCFDSNNLRGTCPRSCSNNCDCNQGERCVQGTCTAQFGAGYCCSKPGCPANFSCTNTNGTTGRCPVQTCTSACNCNQGEDCRNGQCTRVFPPVYCCANTGCPTGSACINAQGQWSTCGGQPACTSACDCNQGEDCYRGQCIRTSPATYCCEKTGCPAGTACVNSQNVTSVCPGVQCTTSCDCNTGQACVRGRCVSTSPATYCCDKTPCPSGNTCEDKSGNIKTCPGPTCTTACDCNQGEDCRGGQCTRVSPAVYCCSKSPCIAGQACVNTNGSSSTCPVQCQTHCDCNQGQRCVNGTCYNSGSTYCCSKTGCPAGRTCYNQNNTTSTCGTSGSTCRVRCDCNQGEECVNGTCQVSSGVPAFCCDKPGCPPGFSCLNTQGTSGFCPTTPPPTP